MTEPKKTVRVLKINRLRSDGSLNRELIELVVRDPYTGEDLPDVVITLKPIGEDERKAIVAMYTSPERDPGGGRGLYELTKHVEVTDEVIRRSVQAWRGLVGADDQALVCTQATAVLLDANLKAQITRKLFGVEAVEVAAESFR